jgi:hypothetical protein
MIKNLNTFVSKSIPYFMKITIYLFLMSICLVTASNVMAQVPSGTNNDQEFLFNGKDLNNWTFYLKDPAADPNKVFTIRDGVIHITGDPFGYMRTRETYADYELHLEWRWPVEATNSGVFLHAQQPDAIWPSCFECQLQAGKAGEFICMSGTKMNEQKTSPTYFIPTKNPSNEKPVGEWNSLVVKCKGSTIEVNINGVLQNSATGTSVSSGSICLQSEGKDIEFRNVYITR